MQKTAWLKILMLFAISMGGFSFPASAESANKVQIYGLAIPGLHQADFQGAYDKIIQRVALVNNLATLDVYPPARALKQFAECQNCCITPMNTDPEFYDIDPDVIATAPLNIAKIYIFTAPGSAPVTTLKELEGKVVGARFGMPYGRTFERSSLDKYMVSKLSEHIKLLERNHIDAFIAYAPDVFHMFEALNLAPYPHDAENPYAVHPDKMVCRGVEHNVINTFNRLLAELQRAPNE